jgi:hypothetical protein
MLMYKTHIIVKSLPIYKFVMLNQRVIKYLKTYIVHEKTINVSMMNQPDLEKEIIS